MKYKVSVIVPTLNNVDGLSYLLNYFLKKNNLQLIIVDNNPNIVKFRKQINWDLEFKDQKRFKNVVYLPQRKNLGFAGAVNLGAKYAEANWLLFLNDDVRFDSNQLKSNFDKDPIEALIYNAQVNKLDVASPILINPDGNVENFGYQVLPFGKVKLFKSLDEYNENVIDGLTAACLLIRKKVFEKLGGFDEKFFAYLEDVDLFLTIKEAGFRFGLFPQIAVFHYHQKTSSTMGFFKEKQDLINWWRLALKHRRFFKFNFKFFIERLRNLSGLFKAILKTFFTKKT
ncbi:MAG: hypothetical protein KatS3mg093_377 [Candidatus Parcubacteria bacterium]|nr:MAG: hypothetical protein KatS3mg093_377 [Candidatus Parcubacteria bacterium]